MEPRVVELVGRGGVRMPADRLPAFEPARHPELAGADVVARHHEGWCAFFELDGRLCAIHRQAGESALPSSCRHFPRVYLRDRRGQFVTLSHFCPTAASLLLEERPLEIVRAPAPLALDGATEGLDASDTLPPLLRPDLLSDLEGYEAWERAAIATIARADLTHEAALGALDAAVERIRAWRPGGAPLAEAVAAIFAEVHGTTGRPDARRAERGDGARLQALDRASYLPERRAVTPLPEADAVWPRLVAPAWPRFDRAIKRYLASRLFATWIAYQGRGLRSIVEWLRICLALLRHEAAARAAREGTMLNPAMFLESVRATDLVLLHRISTVRLARDLAAIE